MYMNVADTKARTAIHAQPGILIRTATRLVEAQLRAMAPVLRRHVEQVVRGLFVYSI